MIAKGTAHRDGAVLARYLVTGKERERAELWQLRGFACAGIVAAFRSVHVMAAATKCTAPFFHVCIRNRDTEHLDKLQWEHAANAIERALGLTDQPRALAFHTAADSGQAHLHVAWSRIDEGTLTARPLPFFKHRLKQVSRELEKRFRLTPVANQRESPIRFAPTRAEEEQARRLRVDVHATRETIRDCFERTDCGRRFRDALAREGFVLARGDRRDFLVVDRAGGMHAIGKRILGVSAAEIRDRLADLCRDLLPTLEQAREFIAAAKQVSLDNKVDDFRSHDRDAPKPVSESKRTRHGGPERKTSAAGKEQPGDRVRKQPAITHSAVPLDHLVTDARAPGDWLESGAPAVGQLRNEAPELAADPAQDAEVLHSTDGPQDGADEPFSPDETAGLEPTAGALPQLEQTPSTHSTPGYAARLRDQFRALVKQLTAKVLEPRPTPRKRRREEIGGGFRKAAFGLLRRIAGVPLLHFVDATWEPFTWLRIWEYNCPASADFHQDCAVSPPPEDPSLRL